VWVEERYNLRVTTTKSIFTGHFHRWRNVTI